MEQDPGFIAAVEEAKQGLAEGGVPIGAALVSKDGKILGRGHNMRVQKGSAILHAEMSALENSGRLPASAYEGATMYTTLSPCDMCTGACLLYKVKRVVIGENKSFMGGEDLLKNRGAETVVLDNQECKDLMDKFMKDSPELWYVLGAWFAGEASASLSSGLGSFIIINTNCSVRCSGTRISGSNLMRLLYIAPNTMGNEIPHQEVEILLNPKSYLFERASAK
ncbi:unnamed protein product [Penicillium olsonii]|nr:unnamed protein product [Penicillium olsonii]